MNYEIHITLKVSNIEEFKADCAIIGVKPIIIETQNGNEFQNQIMTSSKHSGSHYLFNLNRIASGFEDYEILRKKVEIQPEEQKNSEHIYYESHLRLKLPKQFDYSIIKEICKNHNLHLSKNLFKTSEDFNWQMITYRGYDKSYTEFTNSIKKIKSDLDLLAIPYDKIEIEECIFDSNELIDKEWLKKL